MVLFRNTSSVTAIILTLATSIGIGIHSYCMGNELVYHFTK